MLDLQSHLYSIGCFSVIDAEETRHDPSSFECSHNICLAPIWTADGFNWLRYFRDDGFFHFMYEHLADL